jgi:malate synthase
LQDGGNVTPELVSRIGDDELARLREALGEDTFRTGRFDEAREIFDRLALSPEFEDFLTLPAYERLN